MIFVGEQGSDGGGLTREFFKLISSSITSKYMDSTGCFMHNAVAYQVKKKHFSYNTKQGNTPVVSRVLSITENNCLRIGTQSSCLIRSGILNHIEEGRGKCGVGWWMISLNL